MDLLNLDKVDESEMAYMMGVVESHCVFYHKRYKPTSKSFRSRMVVTSLDAACLVKLQSVFGGSLQERNQGMSDTRYTWQLGKNDTLNFLDKVEPFIKSNNFKDKASNFKALVDV